MLAANSSYAPAPGHRFDVGDAVRVKASFPPGHRRTPWYIRGKRHDRAHLRGFPNPEELAYGFDGEPKKVLYRVRFPQKRRLAAIMPARRATSSKWKSTSTGSSRMKGDVRTRASRFDYYAAKTHAHEHDDHDHDHDDHAPVNEHDNGPPSDYEIMSRAMQEILEAKGVVTAEEIAAAHGALRRGVSVSRLARGRACLGRSRIQEAAARQTAGPRAPRWASTSKPSA